MLKCPAPAPLPDLATANDLTEFALGWIRAAACEHAKRLALLEAWPK